jgi:RRXRR protein
LSVLVLDQRKRPVMPGSEKLSRLPPERSRAVVGRRRYPLTIRLKDSAGGDVGPVRVKLDPGRTTTGIVVIADEIGDNTAVCTTSVRGFQTGGVVRAEVPTGKKAANHAGRVPVRGSGLIRVGNADGINATSCKLLHRADGYCYARQPALPPRRQERGCRCGRL